MVLTFTKSVQDKIWFSNIFLKTFPVCPTGDAQLLILVFLQETKPEQGVSGSGLTGEDSSQMSMANRYPQNYLYLNKWELPFKNEIKLSLIIQQRNTASVKSV